MKHRTPLALALLAALSACGTTPPAHFYTLSSLRDAPAAARPAPRAEFTLGIGPVTLPRYLDRPQIVSYSSGNELRLDDMHRWAEPLEQNFTRTLTENLTFLLGSERVVPYPGRRGVTPDAQVQVEVIRFDARADGTVTLHARWGVLDRGGIMVAAKRTDLEQKATGGDFNALVAAHSEAVARLSHEITSVIEKIAPVR
jgi:hypothetical protein